MAITTSDLPELVRLLQQHPEWREALRLILLGEELLNLPHLVSQVVQGQQEIVGVLQEVVRILQRHEQLIGQLIEGQRRHSEAIEQLTATQQRHSELIEQLIATQQRHSEEIAEMRAVLTQVLEVQQRHSELIEQLIATQQRHSELIEQLIATQQRHSEEITEMRAVQQRHAEAILRLEQVQQRLIEEFEALRQEVRGEIREVREEIREIREEVREVREEVRELRSEMGRMTQTLGLTMEEHAEDVLITVMERKGWRLIRGPNSLSLDGELDLIAVFEDEVGQQRTVLMEVKLRLSRREVEAWADRVRSEGFLQQLQEQGFAAPYHPYLFGFRIDVAADETARRRRVGLMTSRGEIVEPEVIE
jgi:methyl-accepting chemotaxis protein